MVKLERYNEFVTKVNFTSKKGNFANVECDKCDGEMIYMDDYILTSNPPKAQVKCIECGYVGYKVI